MPDNWYIKAAIPLSQKAAVENTLRAHGIPLEQIQELGICDAGVYLPPFLELVFPIEKEQALGIAKAIAHAAKVENPKASKIFILRDYELVHLPPQKEGSAQT